MNSVQFGRWLSERRRACGWPSQRLLAEATQQHSFLNTSGISEDFLARLEAGHLAYPFRGTVRRRILQLAWLVCKTPRDLKTYLKAAGLNDLSDEEQTQLHLLGEHVTALQTPPPLLLPPRPQRLKGREGDLALLMQALSKAETQVFSLTGMPGVGKSALAYEALHQLAAAESAGLRRFPDGIATFTCTGRQGTRGLISLLTEITALFSLTEQSWPGSIQRWHTRKYNLSPTGNLTLEHSEDETELASTIDRARATLVNRRVLLLLDDVDPLFPLRQALDVLLAPGSATAHDQKAEQVIITTSQFIPAPTLTSERLHLHPLNESAALELLAELLGEKLSAIDLPSARQACAAVGYLPLAIESMATAVLAKGIPLALVATHLTSHPLESLFNSEEELITKLEKALAFLDQELRSQYILLAALDLTVFNLEAAAALISPDRLHLPAHEQSKNTETRSANAFAEGQPVSHSATLADCTVETPSLTRHPRRATWEMACGEHIPDLTENARREEERMHQVHLASAAATLGHFVRSSLLELLPCSQRINNKTSGDRTSTGTLSNEINYRMHPLLRVFARDMARTLPRERLELARHNLLGYALDYIARVTESGPDTACAGGRAVVLVGLELAWSEKRYEIAMHLAQGLILLEAPLEGEEGENILQKGLYASQQLQNQPAIISFLDLLAGLRCYHGDLANAQQMWEAALRIQESVDTPSVCWHPLIGLARLARMQGDFQAARRFNETYAQRTTCSADHLYNRVVTRETGIKRPR